MTAPVFTWIASPDSSGNFQPRTIESQFGDGYAQRFRDGINTNPGKFPLKFDYRDPTEGLAILGFLDARAGSESFVWKQSHNNLYIAVVCKDYGLTQTTPNGWSLSATFEQVFDAVAVEAAALNS